MAASCKSQILLVIMLTIWQALSVASAARPLNRIVPPPTSPDPEPASALYLALPRRGDAVEAVVIPAGLVTELGIIVPGEEMGSRSISSPTASGLPRRGGGSRTFGPMFLNFLPKGSPPPSGPSKGTNSLKN
ncbi:uncharacterized protein LOC115743719 [Rhodamnia argentea]|uniref:Uncharacterized protein LOC115743719 n=1 Tax=Rhodamnia argentea TaxID=178133 RepID=A0A8B8PI70_9MYRT|nr:uncharacterized protein LOC115743719 [Rhodamnia argentea]